jgi:hypothetical protein
MHPLTLPYLKALTFSADQRARGETTFLIAGAIFTAMRSSKTSEYPDTPSVLDEHLSANLTSAIRKVVSPRAQSVTRTALGEAC